MYGWNDFGFVMGLIYNRICGLFGIPSNVWSLFFVAFWLMNVLVSGVKVHCIVYCFFVDRGLFCWGRVRYMASVLWSFELCLFSWVTRYWWNGSCAFCVVFNPLNPELNPICYLLALLAHHFLHVSRIRVKSLTIRLLMSYIYGAPILDVSRSYTTTRHSR